MAEDKTEVAQVFFKSYLAAPIMIGFYVSIAEGLTGGAL
jgi:hypothetical protein